jgi:hypothetical protein
MGIMRSGAQAIGAQDEKNVARGVPWANPVDVL